MMASGASAPVEQRRGTFLAFGVDRLALPGDRAARDRADPHESRFAE
jgi:hypothetical protein